MKALVKLQSGIIRVENPPMSEVAIAKDEISFRGQDRADTV